MLTDPPETTEVRELYAGELANDGYVWNVSRLWCWRPDLYEGFAGLRTQLTEGSSLSDRECAVLVVATATALGDSYCAFAWGKKLTPLADDEAAARVVTGETEELTPREQALADWARRVVKGPNETTDADVERLRAVGLDDREIFEATVWIAFRLAFSTVNDALGVGPDRQLVASVPTSLQEAVTFGRPVA